MASPMACRPLVCRNSSTSLPRKHGASWTSTSSDSAECATISAPVVDDARKTGYTETILGRRRFLPDLTSDNRQRRQMAERMALNAPIQGSAADIVKLAMLGVDRRLREAKLTSRLMLQVHDELLLEIAPGEREQVEHLVREEMGGAYSLKVPLDVWVGVGRTWEAAAH